MPREALRLELHVGELLEMRRKVQVYQNLLSQILMRMFMMEHQKIEQCMNLLLKDRKNTLYCILKIKWVEGRISMVRMVQRVIHLTREDIINIQDIILMILVVLNNYSVKERNTVKLSHYCFILVVA